MKQTKTNSQTQTEWWLSEGKECGEGEVGQVSQVYGDGRKLDFGW